MTDLAAIKQRQQQTWASGDFAMVATTSLIVGELLCEAVDLRAGHKVLDVATGSGNTALAAARRWCDVTGIDYVPSLHTVVSGPLAGEASDRQKRSESSLSCPRREDR